MRLGGPIFGNHNNPGEAGTPVGVQTPQEWVNAVLHLGYSAAYCPVGLQADLAQIAAYAKAAQAANIVIAEVGAWSNPLSPDDKTRQAAVELNKRSLELAERIGARCCVNITGSRGEKWDGPSELDLTTETFDMIVVTVREIIDAVAPRRSFYTLETMPWMYPDSTESYLRLLHAIDRPALAVHFDPVNLVCSPQRYFANGGLISEFVAELGPWIKSVHAKDILLGDRLTTHLDEARPGLGRLDYRRLLRELNRLDPDLPVMLEHLPSAQEYILAASYIRNVASEVGVSLAAGVEY
jgi:sugar phosphate isomerase/epimerase